jgi:hypothetical protein
MVLFGDISLQRLHPPHTRGLQKHLFGPLAGARESSHECSGEAFNTLQDLIADHQSREFSIVFASCEPLAWVSMDVRTKLYTRKPNGRPDYLSIGEHALPTE